VLKKTITYEDFNGETKTEDFFFHLSKAELVELELSHQGGLSASLQRIIDAEDGKGIVQEFKNIILSAYGKKSDDGRRFIKNQQIREEFESTEAYSALFMELVTDTDAAVEFINGVIPAGMAEEAAALASPAIAPVEESVKVIPTPEPQVDQPTDEPYVYQEPEVVSRADLLRMSAEDVQITMRRIEAGQAKLEE
jgi:hypothetical protein